ncbi:hypothetical protein Ancab_012266 [Ancistrocladus abbreviatus]
MEGLSFLIPYDLEAKMKVGTIKEQGEEGEVQSASPAMNSKEPVEINNEPRRLADSYRSSDSSEKIGVDYEKGEEPRAGMVNHINDRSSLFPGVVASGYINLVPCLRAMEPSFCLMGNVGETKETSLGREGDIGPKTGIGVGCEMDAEAELG